jgi:hypothetical protein
VSHGLVIDVNTNTLFTGLEHLGAQGEPVFKDVTEGSAFHALYPYHQLSSPEQKNLAGNAVHNMVLGQFCYYVLSSVERVRS